MKACSWLVGALHALGTHSTLSIKVGCGRSSHGKELAAGLDGLLEVTLHVEGVLGELVTSALEEGAEALNGVADLDELTWLAREDLRHVEWLGEETLDLTGTGDGKLIFFRQIVHTQNSNNILQGSVVLEKLLHTTSNVVVGLADDGWVQHTGGGIKWIHSWVNTKLSQGTGQHSGGVQVSEGGGWGWIGQIISWHVHSLHGGNGTVLGGGNTLLETTQIGSEGWLVTHSGRNTTEQGRHLGAGLGESEDVVDEEQHILVLLISEVLSDGETGETDTGTGTWWLVHLTVHEGGLGAWAVNLDDTRVNHLVVEIVTLTGALTDTGEDGETTVSLGDVVNQLHDKHSLSDTGTTEETNLTTLGVWSQKINNLNTYIIIN